MIALGLDFGTESVRALAVDCRTGEERAECAAAYRHGVLTERLPGSAAGLPADFALQHPGDWTESCREAIRGVMRVVRAEEIIGIGVDFTACTMLPVSRAGEPLMLREELRAEPHAWPKLWKHHGAEPEAVQVNALARERGEKFLAYYGGSVSCEWMLPKCWEILRRAPDVYREAALFIDAGDWLVHQLTGRFSRNSCAAGYKGLWSSELGFPSPEFLRALDPGLADLRDKWLQNVIAPGTRVGGVTRAFAESSGLIEGTPVSAATIDAHSGVAGMGVYREGALSLILGTSTCHLALSSELKLFDGLTAVVKDGILPGFYGYESGQPAVGDLFGWFARSFLRSEPGADPFTTLSAGAAALRPGESGLVALDWMNGNRSVLMDAGLSGAIIGLTLKTRPEEVYRALVEATALGTRRIVDSYVSGGVPIHEGVVCGGLAREDWIPKLYSDVTGLPVKVAASGQAVALGAAIFGALAAGAQGGGHGDVETAVVSMTRPPARTHEPDPTARRAYDELYAIYLRSHDFFGREEPSLMSRLRNLRKGQRHS